MRLCLRLRHVALLREIAYAAPRESLFAKADSDSISKLFYLYDVIDRYFYNSNPLEINWLPLLAASLAFNK